MGDVLYAATQFRPKPFREEWDSYRAHVVLVEPDPATLAAMEQALQAEGFVTATAFDALGAIAAAERLGAVDVVVANVRATQMRAVELTELLRSRHSGLQALYVTSRQDELFERPLLLSGDDDVIEKPFSEGELVEAVSSLLR